MKKAIALAALALSLSACSGANVGLGAGTGFPGIGLGAGVSVPVGGKSESAKEAYVQQIIDHVYSHVDDIDEYEGKLCTLRITADSDGMLMDVKRMEGDDGWCDALMVAAYKFNSIPKPPANMVDRLKRGLVIDFIP